MRPHRRFPALVLAAFLAPFSLPAESVTVSTVPFGGMILEIPAGTSIVSDVFIGSALYQGPVVSISPEDDVLFLNSMPAIESASYIHVLSGADQGMVSTILNADSESVTVETPLVLAEGDVVAIRKHQTIGAFFAGAAFSMGDTITFYNIDGTITSVTYFGSSGWLDSDLQDGSDLLFLPGEALVVNISQAISIIASGSVNTHLVSREFVSGAVALIGTINPIGGGTLSELFSDGAMVGDTVTFYENSNGTLFISGSYTYFGSSGYLDDELNSANDVKVPVAGAAVLQSGNSRLISILPAYSENQKGGG